MCNRGRKARRPLISILCPSRGRPLWAKRMKESALDTARGPVEVFFGCDEDDITRKNYPDVFVTLPDWGYGYKAHALASLCNGDILFPIGDDTIFYTDGWDDSYREVAQAYPDGIFCICADDNLQKLGTEKIGYPHPAVGRKWFEILGYVYHPMFIHFSGDRWLTDLARRVGRFHYLDSVVIAHHRVRSVAGIPKDETYSRIRNNKMISTRDEGVFLLSRRYMEVDAMKLIGEMDDV